MPGPSHGNRSVILALTGNFLVTLLKTAIALSTSSASMFAESVHSLADTLNQALLLIGIRRSKRPADDDHGYGYGIERFFWSLISACGILFIGAGVTVYHSIETFLSPSLPAQGISLPIIGILVASLIVEGCTFLVAFDELRENGLSRKTFESADPIVLAVVYEDGAAVIGVLIALFAQFLTYTTGDPHFDAVGGLFVGLLLAILAILLIIKNHQYIIGKPLDDETEEKIVEFLHHDPCIEKVVELKTTAVDIGKYRIFATVEWNGSPLYEEIYDDGDLKEEYDEIKDDFSEFAKLMFKTTDRIPRLVGNHIDKVEKAMREKFPQVAYVDIEIN